MVQSAVLEIFTILFRAERVKALISVLTYNEISKIQPNNVTATVVVARQYAVITWLPLRPKLCLFRVTRPYIH